MTATSTTARVLDLRPRLPSQTNTRPVSSEPIECENPTPNEAGSVVLICEREMLAKGAFESFARSAKARTLLDLRPSASMTFIGSSRPYAFRLFEDLGIRYVDVAAHVGKPCFRDDYWESEALSLAIAHSIDRVHRIGGILVCLFGSRSQLRQGRPTVHRGLEQSTRVQAHARVSHYRSGLYVM